MRQKLLALLFLLSATVTMAATSEAATSQAATSPVATPPSEREAAFRQAATLITPSLEQQLVATHGEAQRERIRRGLRQVLDLWRSTDGDVATFSEFVSSHFAGNAQDLDTMFARFEHHLEQIGGHAQEVRRELNAQVDLDRGLVTTYDSAFAAFNPTAHLLDDLFDNQLAFTVLLNFPLTSLEERRTQGASWTRRQWAETQLAETFRQRIPAEASKAVSEAYARSGEYIARYNLWMHHLVDAKGTRLFAPDKRLLSHWNLRDEIKASYADAKAGLAKQRLIQRAMERIVAQEIPSIVVDNPKVDWDPETNRVTMFEGGEAIEAAREDDDRYARWLANFQAQREVDRHSPTQNTLIARAFEGDRQLPEARVQAMLEQVLGSPQVKQTARLITKRLGRRLEPFDIWYSGFRGGEATNEAQLDAMVAGKYPDAAAFQRDLPQILRGLGFAAERAEYLSRHIVVEPARGSGHAMGAELRGANAHLRTRIERGGMNYKGYNIAIHEMCHNVEQTFSLNDIDFYSLRGVPNTAFTEALAFTCQNRDLELLGLSRPDPQQRALAALDTFWSTYEIAGVALVDMLTWRWLYAHPETTRAELREAVLGIARETWNRWYAPVFGVRDVTLLGIYSHSINETLYLPDYPVGHLIAYQVEAQMEKAGDFGREFERMARIGAVTPDLWMVEATGRPLGPEALLEAAQQALRTLR